MTVFNVQNFSEKSNENLDLPLIERDGVKLVDSRTIAEALGLEHESLMKNVKLNEEAIEKGFGILRFEIGEIKGRGQPEKFALLTEDQAIFVGTLSRNTEKVVEFKVRLITTFQKMRRAAENIASGSGKEDLDALRIKNNCKSILETIYNATLPNVDNVTIGSLIQEITAITNIVSWMSIRGRLDSYKNLRKNGIRVEWENDRWILWLSDSHKVLAKILTCILIKKWGAILSRIDGAEKSKVVRFAERSNRATGIPITSVNALLNSQYLSTVRINHKSSKFSGTVPEAPKKINLILKSKSNRPVTVILTVD